MIKSLLIANRGEIACRVIRTARRLGIRTIAVYSDADAKALHVRMADDAVHIGPSPARESYLVGEKIIEAAKATRAEAIHPGYGFLSENAEFAESVIDAGLIWVGPKPDSIRAMGLKDAAKKLMADAGVPVTPGYLGEDQDPNHLKKETDAIGYPVLIKAVAGGGGKGMRRVDRAQDFADALESCKREAASSFGDDRVLIEKYILSPRHIEVQVFGDSYGNVVHLFERDCSLQRRHQKVIEEAPAPGMDMETREAVCGAAVRAAQAVNYEGAGTIEFIADASEGLKPDRIWFMEMNTRLQVEHPVTEEITGQDLVEWQLRVASGEALPKRQDELTITGHAIEARLYAENPANGFLPVIGTVGELQEFRGGPVRLDTAVVADDEVTPFYDPMLAKLIASGSDREDARRWLVGEIGRFTTWPLTNNAGFLWRLLTHPDFVAAKLDTGFIERRLEELIAVPEPSEKLRDAAATALFADLNRDAFDAIYSPGGAVSPWIATFGFRLNGPRSLKVRMSANGRQVDGYLVPGADYGSVVHYNRGEGVLGVEDGESWFFTQHAPRASGGAHGIHEGEIEAPMPGKVTAVEVAAGDKVARGQRLLTLEAMKMEHALTAPFDGTVAELNAAPGQQVTEGTMLVRVDADE